MCVLRAIAYYIVYVYTNHNFFVFFFFILSSFVFIFPLRTSAWCFPEWWSRVQCLIIIYTTRYNYYEWYSTQINYFLLFDFDLVPNIESFSGIFLSSHLFGDAILTPLRKDKVLFLCINIIWKICSNWDHPRWWFRRFFFFPV